MKKLNLDNYSITLKDQNGLDRITLPIKEYDNQRLNTPTVWSKWSGYDGSSTIGQETK